MQLLDYVVREDWRQRTQQMMRENTRLWRGLQALVVFSALASMIVLFLCPFQPWESICYTVLSSCLFIGFSVWAILRPEKHAIAYTGLATSLLACAAAVGGLLRPPLGIEHDVVEDLWALGGTLAMLSSWGLLVWAYGRRKETVERLGVTTERWAGNALIGGVVGAALGVHSMLAGQFAGLEYGIRPSWATLVWQVAFWAGLRGLGEELLFRGLGFRLLRTGLDRSFWATAVPLTVLNLLPYLATSFLIANEPAGPWVLSYVALMALSNVALREWRRSLVPCLACNLCLRVVLLIGLGYAV
jgi:hypothetical protein